MNPPNQWLEFLVWFHATQTFTVMGNDAILNWNTEN